MNYEDFMKICINLAKQATGNVSPNPLVGCVVLNKDNRIISEGFHEKYGGNHAERNALLKLSEDDAHGGTLVVNLEPCCHTGKTPPCTDLIINKGVKKVVIGMRDVNPIVSGKGVKKLKDFGIEVVEGILEEECRKLNEIFIKNMTEHKTFVAIKTASTLDGKIATSSGSSKWITSDKARDEAKGLRNKYDAILTSASTVIADNPKMIHKNKIILDRNLKTDFQNSRIYDDGNIYVFYDKNINKEHLQSILSLTNSKDNINLFPIGVDADKINLELLLDKIYELGIMSIFVEAGGHLCGSFLKYADRIYQFIAPKILGDNLGLSCFDFRSVNSVNEALNFKFDEIIKFEKDILITYTK